MTEPQTILIIQARLGASRLPGKVLLPLGGKPVLEHVYERCRRATTVHKVLIATTLNPLDDVLEAWCHQRGYPVYRGDENNVLSRYVELARQTEAEIIVRVTADCPLIDPVTIDRVIQALRLSDSDYAHVMAEEKFPEAMPRGFNVEAFWAQTLGRIEQRAALPRHREHVTLLVEENSSFKILRLASPKGWARPHYRLTLDTPLDFIMLQRLFVEGGVTPDTPFQSILTFLDQHPEIASINSSIKQKEAV
jgi:spore coat polysaccharide biosynthesis protein SpsF